MGAVVDGADPIIVPNEDVISMMGVSEAEFDEELEARARRDRKAPSLIP